MSEFDKEAEREKLREQFAEDRADRASTERMSELLLQGATMTNRHCDECGNPIFRVDDREFCPTCQDDVPTDGQATGPDRAEPDTTTADTGDRPAAPAGQTGTDSEVAADGQSRATPDQPPRPDTTPAATPSGTTDGLAPARAALERTVNELARRAAESDDPDRTREHLAAAREAAEALAAVKRAGR